MVSRKIFSALMTVCIAAPCMAGSEDIDRRQERVRVFLKRTAVIIVHAKQKVDENRVYTGNLARAVSHQKFAVRLYRQGRYRQSLQHSRRARHLALLAIRANRGTPPKDGPGETTGTDEPGKAPSDAELDGALAQAMSSETTRDDKVAFNTADIDVK